jgi:hypothetical protein
MEAESLAAAVLTDHPTDEALLGTGSFFAAV